MAKSIIPASMRLFYEEFHFSPAVLDKDILRCSGVIGVDPTTMKASVDPVTQFEQAFLSLGEVLKEAGGDYTNILEMTTFHIGLNEHLKAFMSVKDKYIEEPYPAWTAIGVSELAFPDALLEIRVNARMD